MLRVACRTFKTLYEALEIIGETKVDSVSDGFRQPQQENTSAAYPPEPDQLGRHWLLNNNLKRWVFLTSTYEEFPLEVAGHFLQTASGVTCSRVVMICPGSVRLGSVSGRSELETQARSIQFSLRLSR